MFLASWRAFARPISFFVLGVAIVFSVSRIPWSAPGAVPFDLRLDQTVWFVSTGTNRTSNLKVPQSALANAPRSNFLYRPLGCTDSESTRSSGDGGERRNLSRSRSVCAMGPRSTFRSKRLQRGRLSVSTSGSGQCSLSIDLAETPTHRSGHTPCNELDRQAETSFGHEQMHLPNSPFSSYSPELSAFSCFGLACELHSPVCSSSRHFSAQCTECFLC